MSHKQLNKILQKIANFIIIAILVGSIYFLFTDPNRTYHINFIINEGHYGLFAGTFIHVLALIAVKLIIYLLLYWPGKSLDSDDNTLDENYRDLLTGKSREDDSKIRHYLKIEDNYCHFTDVHYNLTDYRFRLNILLYCQIYVSDKIFNNETIIDVIKCLTYLIVNDVNIGTLRLCIRRSEVKNTSKFYFTDVSNTNFSNATSSNLRTIFRLGVSPETVQKLYDI